MMVNGHCLCGAVTFSGRFPGKPEYGVCHCSMCQRWTGGPGFAADLEDVSISSPEAMTWYKSSDWAERGFCTRCGSSLFYKLKLGEPRYIVYVGSLDPVEGLTLSEHIFVDSQPGHYAFSDHAPRVTAAEFLARFEEPSS